MKTQKSSTDGWSRSTQSKSAMLWRLLFFFRFHQNATARTYPFDCDRSESTYQSSSRAIVCLAGRIIWMGKGKWVKASERDPISRHNQQIDGTGETRRRKYFSVTAKLRGEKKKPDNAQDAPSAPVVGDKYKWNKSKAAVPPSARRMLRRWRLAVGDERHVLRLVLRFIRCGQ